MLYTSVAPRFVEIPFDFPFGPSKELFEGNFVKIIYTEQPDLKDFLHVSKHLSTHGAKGVDYKIVREEEEATQKSSSKFQPGMDFEEMIDEYVQLNADTLDKEVLTGLGKELLEAANKENKDDEQVDNRIWPQAGTG